MIPSSPHRAKAMVVLAVAITVLGGLLGCTSGEEFPATEPSTTTLTTTPTGVRWQPFQGMDLPITDQGPAHVEGPVATGFGRSPAGAALAAIHAVVRMSVATDIQYPQVGHRMLAPGPGRDAWGTARAQRSITTPITSNAPKILGYKVTGYTPDTAHVEIYSVHADNSVTRNTARVIWQRQDWLLHLPETPTTNPVTTVTIPPADMVALVRR